MARVNCLRLLTHWARRAASRADCTAGSNREIRTAMIAITTSSSIRVKPVRRQGSEVLIEQLLFVDGRMRRDETSDLGRSVGDPGRGRCEPRRAGWAPRTECAFMKGRMGHR